MLPRPPSSTLFPYTTLFRSHVVGRAGGDRQRGLNTRRGRRRHCREDGGQPGGRENDPAARDRKSTRLNSSHLGISYAVFCLKKKRTTYHKCDSINKYNTRPR